jgi:hypothetical protein
MASPYEKRIQSILGAYITPYLHEQGFARDGNKYSLKLAELTWLIEIERSGFNDSTQARFTVDCCVFVPGVVSRYLGKGDPARPGYPDCVLHSRLGWLAEDRLDTWWTLSTIDNAPQIDAEVGRDIVERLGRDGLPFLHRFRARANVLDFLVESRKERDLGVDPREGTVSLAYASILSLLMCDEAQSHALWDKAVLAAAKGPLESLMPTIQRRVFG